MPARSGSSLSRRSFLSGAGAAALAAGAGGSGLLPASAADAPAAASPYRFFNADEAAFIEAAVARLIPSDELGPGAVDADVPRFIDRQLDGAWGAGERLYRSGPWYEGTPSQGYQLPFTPAELFRNALRAVLDDLRRRSTADLAAMPERDQDAYLTALQNGEHDLGGVPANVFFESLLEMTIEGYFCDPVYGGNKDMGAWKMIGFPGAYANYYHLVDRHGLAFDRAPVSLAEDAAGHIHIDPDIPARVGWHGAR